ncbi:AgmX/PglI C-terminal domain-containing protein [Solimonas variicoloris]|uniref:AgmX/PglI C-terminal domain-containing protein n=1 Tax=Solimonas variicoloris TaxID=254408 RepID=UPI000365C7AE|nr:AgmX/PglI C-terminal domain-containing protein [Solimonas variicoloris]
MNASFVTAFDGWDLNAEADRRFRRIAGVLLAIFVVLGIVIPLIRLTGLQRGGGETIEQRYVSILPDAPIAEQVEEPKPSPEDSKKPPQEQAKSEKPQQDKPEAPPQPTPAERQAQARAVAQKSGVLAMADQLAELRDQSLRGLDTTRALSSERVAAQAGTGASGGSSAAFADAAASGSGGIGATGTGEERRTQSGAGLGQRRTTTVEAPRGTGPDRSKPGQGGDKLLAGRTLEEIQLTFDRNKGAFYAIFNRAMRENPGIGPGKIVVSLTIAPDGSVTDCKLVSSTFGDADLERKVIQRVLLLNFGPKNVPPFTYPNYPINFLPS